MKFPRDRGEAVKARRRKVALALCSCAFLALTLGQTIRGADEAAPNPSPMFKQYCFQCHGKTSPMAGISIEQLTAQASVGDGYQSWEKIAAALETNHMPPKGLPQPSDAQRRDAVAWIRAELGAFARKNAGDPGRVTVRRLTSGEYGYAIEDLTGLEMETGIDASSDSVGGEGFTNFGDVQFMQDANLERYLEAAKLVANHAVIGAGPLSFYRDPGKSGFEMAAIARIKEIYTNQGFRTVSGEGGFPYGLDKYGKVFYTAWRYQNRAALGEPKATYKDIAAREGITQRFAEHIWSVINRPGVGYPTSEAVARFRKLPPPAAGEPAIRAACADLQKFVTTWPSWLFARGDVAVGGAGDESPLLFNDAALKVDAKHHFQFLRGGRAGARGPAPTGPAKIYLNVAAVNPAATGKSVIVWRNATIGFRPNGMGRGPAQPVAGDQNAANQAGAGVNAGAVRRGLPPVPRHPLREVVTEESAAKLAFGKSLDSAPVGENDFASDSSVSFEVKLPEGVSVFDLQIDAEVGADRDQVFRIVVTDRADGSSRGIPIRALLGDPQSHGFQTFKSGVLEFVSVLPPNSNNEPTPADKDPVPLPFDSTYNVPEHDEFDTTVKYIRDDKFIYEHVLDDATRKKVDDAWTDLYSSFEYHDHYVQLLAKHYNLDLKGKHISQLDEATLNSFPAEARNYMAPHIAEYKRVMAAQAAARPKRVEDCLDFAARAWRRPLTEKEKQSLRSFYDKTMTAEPDHQKAVRALIARVLVSPAFLYRVEQPSQAAGVKPLSDWEMASRLSFFLWASIPDDELRRAAAAGELSNPQQIERQVKRMTADPKARRMATEFFGQWLGFYHFDQSKGVDTSRFPEFTNEVRESMYDEAVSFFEHIVRKDRPVGEILTANYTYLNEPLAKFYGVKKEIKSKTDMELVEDANAFNRGGVLRLGAVLTAFSAPLRTSPVKRGDWVLRRILGTATPPPPADAGSIPADDKLFGGMTVKQRLEVHKRNATCANCHLRIDPLGFALEHYDSTGRWREHYADGKPIEDSAALADKTEIAGVDGLLKYLNSREDQVMKTLSRKLLGYALGRTVQISDQPLIDQLISKGGNITFSQFAAAIAASPQFRNRPARETATAVAAVKNPQQAGAR
jgi:mono/diheme cytochrome c family protein